MKFILNLLANTIAVFVVSKLLPGVVLDSLITAFAVALVLGLLNTFVRPIVTILTLPINILTLGLFSFIINIGFIYLADYLVEGFSIASLLSVLLFGFLVSVVSSFLSKL